MITSNPFRHYGHRSQSDSVDGGNTSLKEEGVLWVKASGKNLTNALQEEIVSPWM